ncbi:MAG: hypothetical protein LBE92_00145 [Chryseobacterium sp.]|jgi:hypothetical protein|uniref:hypothetical protein n=1 Tax=Chryseobacterium sp. TaxID=1871047 RepID=UPI002835C738|nr:hypothetical protein [Chryseobacterium sp.]MDR2234507.1 hypothetical protein [Chryseobacterium sp.]
MKINLIKKITFPLTVVALLAFFTSCEEKYKRPDHYKVDYFKNERQEGKAYIMSRQECLDASELVIESSSIKMADSSSGRGKGQSFYIYQVRSGKIRKTVRDSVMKYPFLFLSKQKLKLEEDSVNLYLKRLDGYEILRRDKIIDYQWLKGAPAYPVKEDQ